MKKKDEGAPPPDEKTRELKAQIDQNLRRVYEQALEEEVPDRFKDLLAQLRGKAGNQ
ncbi:NepR family anti-sigma factor [Actibacterium ureilyticum]|uniref:NepR family anti-sigma factor n=1 Tax=Actibacterium ureilyticum TaxID=1590614 RepID=UPI000BAAF1F1|nr:NepR family anti-sigma factor [Actibacterium ureilyticum]